jgi:hypothetical protein
MVSTWPRTVSEVALERGLVGVDDALHLAGDRAEVAVLDVGVDIEHAADVVVADDGRLGAARDGGDVGEDFGSPGGGGVDGDVFQVRQRLDLVLRGLHDDGIGHAVLRS